MELGEASFDAEVKHKGTEEEEKMIDLCIEAKSASYSPYSKFRVGASLKTKSGKMFKGCNVENSSYGLAICAERCAITKSVSEGHCDIQSIYVTSDVNDFITPCGACRQFIAEFGNSDLYLVKPDRSFKRFKISQLLPFAFVSKDLTKQRV